MQSALRYTFILIIIKDKLIVAVSSGVVTELEALLFAVKIIGVTLATAVPEALATLVGDVVVPVHHVVMTTTQLRRQRTDLGR